MNIKEVKEMAQNMGIKPGKMKKGELIRAIQEAEGNLACFESERGFNCSEGACLWKEECK